MPALIIDILVVAILLGLLYWVLTLIPLPPPVKQVITVVVVVLFVLWIVTLLLGYAPLVPVYRR